MDNEPIREDVESLEIIEEYKQKNKIDIDFLPFPTYDMIQSGYPFPNHGAMVARYYGGTNADGNLIRSTGMWVKLSDVEQFLDEKKLTIWRNNLIG
jgi:hypothetical protein